MKHCGLVVAALVGATAMSGCTYTGEDAAAEELDRAQASLIRELDRFDRGDDPVWLARWSANDSHPLQAPHSAAPGFALTVVPLDWYADRPAGVLEVRIRVDAAAYNNPALGGRSYSAGSAERCVRASFGGDAGDEVDTISCAGRAGKSVPPPEPVPALDEAARARLTAALRAGSFATARQRAERAFPTPDFVIQAEVVDAVWAISVIRPVDYECIGGTRRPDGQVEVFAPDRAMMAPGEGGCDPAWFVRPVRPK